MKQAQTGIVDLDRARRRKGFHQSNPKVIAACFAPESDNLKAMRPFSFTLR
jgi:hypothetical protein